MKKGLLFTILSASLVLLLSNHAFAGGALKLGFDFDGEHEVSAYGSSITEDVDTGISLTGELFGDINENLAIGGGISFQLPRELEDYEGEFYFIPIYAMMRIKFGSQGVSPYLTGQIGYGYFEGDSDYHGPYDLEGGLYYGLGGGLLIGEHFLVELLYTLNEGEYETLDVEYSKLTLNIGYNF